MSSKACGIKVAPIDITMDTNAVPSNVSTSTKARGIKVALIDIPSDT